MGMLGKGVGILAKGIGSGTPSYVLDYHALPDPDPEPHPFRVDLVLDGTTWKFKVIPGTVNSTVPTLDGTLLDANPPPTKSLGSASGYVYLELTYTEGNAFPDSLVVKYETSIPADTDDKCHIALAYIDYSGTTPVKTSQNVLTSLWAERLKCGTNPAEYFVSRS